MTVSLYKMVHLTYRDKNDAGSAKLSPSSFTLVGNVKVNGQLCVPVNFTLVAFELDLEYDMAGMADTSFGDHSSCEISRKGKTIFANDINCPVTYEQVEMTLSLLWER